MRLAGDRETSRACWPCQLDSSKQMFNPIESGGVFVGKLIVDEKGGIISSSSPWESETWVVAGEDIVMS